MQLSQLIHGDCMEHMKNMSDNAFELAIVDPPYGINAPNMPMGSGAPSRGGRTSTAVELKKGRLNQGAGKLKDRALQNLNCDWDYEVPSPEYFEQLFRVSKNQIIWGGNYFHLPPTRGIAVWDKCQPWENFSQVELAWTSFDKPAALYRFATTQSAKGETKIHPTQKPIELYKWLLKRYAKEGDKILDTHVGSASSLIACHDLGFEYLGFEIDEEYYEKAKERLERVKAQASIFDFGVSHFEEEAVK